MIWDKQNAEPAMARKVLNSRFEYIHIFSNDAKRSIGKKDFRGTIDNIFSFKLSICAFVGTGDAILY